MRQFFSVVALLSLLMLAAVAPTRASAGTITVQFTNRTGVTVSFFLNGGSGSKYTIKAGETLAFDMAVDKGVEPIVRIYQATGKPLEFSVAKNGRYAFRIRDGKIKNTED